MNYKEWLAQAIADLAPKNPTENSKIDELIQPIITEYQADQLAALSEQN